MIHLNHINHKMRVNLHCLTCGMKLEDRKIQGVVIDGETYCCQGCALGTGCTCVPIQIERPKAGNRRKTVGQRKAEEVLKVSPNGVSLTTAELKHHKKHHRIPNRHTVDIDGTKLPRGLAKQRDSTTEPARGRSEFRGQMNPTILEKEGIPDRVGFTTI